MIRAILTSGSMRSLRHKPDRSCATKPGHISCHRHLASRFVDWPEPAREHDRSCLRQAMALVRSTLLALALAGPAAADVVVALNGPLTGSSAIFGDQM